MMRIKWANPQKLQGRVQKRKPTKKYQRKTQKDNNDHKSLNDLENELEHALDSLATVTVMLKSLRHAYTTCKSDIDQSSTATRLGAMEKELLTAYDDLGIQVRQLGRHIAKLEKQIKDFHLLNTVCSPTTTSTTFPSTPKEDITPSLTYLPYEAPSSFDDYYYSTTATTTMTSCDTFEQQQQQQQQTFQPPAVAALFPISCTCAECCSSNNNFNSDHYYYNDNDMAWSFPPPDASAPLL